MRPSLSLSYLKSALDQDKAAGGANLRKLKIRSGDTVTVSLATSSTKSPYRVILRFKSGLTVQREVGRFDAACAAQAIDHAWKVIRFLIVVEKEGKSRIEKNKKKGNDEKQRGQE